MITENPFNRSDAESLLSPTGTNNYWEIDGRVIWTKDEWAPAKGPGNQMDIPALPFPFDAKYSAAFMLYGYGALVAEHYGGWENGPDPERFDDFSPKSFARRAVKDAFEAKREAQKSRMPLPTAA